MAKVCILGLSWKTKCALEVEYSVAELKKLAFLQEQVSREVRGMCKHAWVHVASGVRAEVRDKIQNITCIRGVNVCIFYSDVPSIRALRMVSRGLLGIRTYRLVA